jgi:hypothetical protein
MNQVEKNAIAKSCNRVPISVRRLGHRPLPLFGIASSPFARRHLRLVQNSSAPPFEDFFAACPTTSQLTSDKAATFVEKVDLARFQARGGLLIMYQRLNAKYRNKNAAESKFFVTVNFFSAIAQLTKMSTNKNRAHAHESSNALGVIVIGGNASNRRLPGVLLRLLFHPLFLGGLLGLLASLAFPFVLTSLIAHDSFSFKT